MSPVEYAMQASSAKHFSRLSAHKLTVQDMIDIMPIPGVDHGFPVSGDHLDKFWSE